MGGSLLLSLWTASNVSMCIWTMSAGGQRHYSATLGEKKIGLGKFPDATLATRYTRDHGVEGLKVLVGHATLVAHFVHKAVDEAHHRVGHVRALCVLEAALRVVALRHAPRNTGMTAKRRSSW